MPNHFDFTALERLKNQLAAIRRTHVSTMAHYVSEPQTGFWHQPDNRSNSSLSSTATCVSSLVGARLWHDENLPLSKRAAEVAAVLIQKRTSARLDEDNPFSLSYVAEGVLDLIDTDPSYIGATEHKQKVLSEIAPKLVDHLMDKDSKLAHEGSISIKPYPPSAYLTQLVFRVLRRCELANKDVRKAVHSWSRSEINKQVALISADSRVGDPLQLAYALILALTSMPVEETTPEDMEIFRHALALFFRGQKDDGSWYPSRPLFHYPGFGNAYCFEYELLVQLLLCKELQDDLITYLQKFERATLLLATTSYDLNPKKPRTVIGWASGHHPQLEGPESWSTASVYHFAHALDRLLAEAIRRELFSELGIVYPLGPLPPTPPPADDSTSGFAPEFLDAQVPIMPDRHPQSLRETLATRFVYPIAREAERVEHGGSLSKDTPMSGIFFGPPGTSKTELAKIISRYLNWPLLSVDPSYLVKEGLDKVQAMANRLFTAMVMAERIVVLLDEFDEVGRSRRVMKISYRVS